MKKFLVGVLIIAAFLYAAYLTGHIAFSFMDYRVGNAETLLAGVIIVSVAASLGLLAFMIGDLLLDRS